MGPTVALATAISQIFETTEQGGKRAVIDGSVSGSNKGLQICVKRGSFRAAT